MRRILIVGQGSYIGTSFARWLAQWPDEYSVDTIDARDGSWRERSFGGYDSVLHVAGIAHVSKRKEAFYMRVNRDLAIESAAKAKRDGAKQFIFMSSIIVYGADGRIGEPLVITADTVPRPIDAYGRSKLEADRAIQAMAADGFRPVIVRAPMVYGPGCKGNFPRLLKLARICPLFPDIGNERSAIYIDNLCEFLRICIEDDLQGVFFPQNSELLSTKTIIKEAASCLARKIYFTKVFNPILRLLSARLTYLNKIFGGKHYDPEMSRLTREYNLVGTRESIERSCR